MSLRAILLGFLGVLGVCGFSFFNDRILMQTYLVGNNMPVSVYGTLIIFVVLINPLLRRYKFRAGELALALSITLASCCLPGSGLLRTFTSSLLLPTHYQKLDASWREQQILDYVPQKMLPVVTPENEDYVLGGFVQGLGIGSDHVAISEVPWGAWVQPFVFWLPMLFCLWFALIALALVLHKQWATHEHIPYPIASFVDSFLPGPNGQAGSVLMTRLFWIGTVFVLAIHLNNYLCIWFPDELIPVKLRLDLWPFQRKFPMIARGGGGGLFGPTLYFTVIGLCFLIPSDISLTFAMAPWLWALVTGFLVGYGIDINQVVEGSYWYTGLKPRMFMLFGSNLGLFLAMAYTGRHYYWNVIRAAFGRKNKEADYLSIWGCRFFIVFTLIFVGQLVYAGLDWQLAVMYTAVLVIFYVVMSRIICESGLFHLQSNIFPCCIIWGFLGIANLGPRTLLIMQIISVVLVCDPRESLMPFMMNSLKLLDKHRQPMGKASLCAALALIVGLAVAVPLTLYMQYDRGSAIWETWAEQAVPKMQFDNAIAVKRKLIAQGMLESSEAVAGWGRFADISPHPLSMWCFFVGFVLVLLVSAARLRFTWWPLHPLLFVTWNTTHLTPFAGSFFIGWLAKTLVIKYGGNGVYGKVRPLMLGLIAGEILGAIVPSITAAIYYLITSEVPKAFRVLLG